MTFWLDLFTGSTWKEFRDAGARVSGFRAHARSTAAQVQPGDVLLCYLTGVMRWVGALEVIAPSQDESAIWKEDKFPVRFDVRPLVLLDPEHGVPMSELEGKVAFYATPAHRGKYEGFLRSSPRRFEVEADGRLLLDLIKAAERSPVSRPVDPRKLARVYYRVKVKKGKKTVEAEVSVPEREQAKAPEERSEPAAESDTGHTEIQFQLLRLGADLGLNIWVAQNDRSKQFKGTAFSSITGILQTLPPQFKDVANHTIGLLDVLWLKDRTIVAAFEIECTTTVYSGLLRMSDLLALQPNIHIDLFLVAPDDRRNKVRQEILRPTFSLRDPPLAEKCGFLSFTRLRQTVEVVREHGLAKSLRPDFLKGRAEYFTGGMTAASL